MRRLLATAAITTFALFSTACGSDDKASDKTDAAADDADDEGDAADETVTGDDAETDATEAESEDTEATAPENVEDITEQCEAAQARIEALDFTDADTFDVIADEFERVKAFTPDDVDDDIDILNEAYAEMSQVLKESGGDFTDPEVMAKFEEIGTPEVTAASDRLDAYFAAACPGVGDS
jgi:hypothetical protein